RAGARIHGPAPLVMRLRRAVRVILMLVRDDQRLDHLRREAELLEPRRQCTRPEAAVHEHRTAAAGDDQRIAATAGTERPDPHASPRAAKTRVQCVAACASGATPRRPITRAATTRKRSSAKVSQGSPSPQPKAGTSFGGIV